MLLYLVRHPDVVSVFPNNRRHLHTTHSWEFLGLQPENSVLPNSLWEKGNYGEDVIVGHIDTGEVASVPFNLNQPTLIQSHDFCTFSQIFLIHSVHLKLLPVPWLNILIGLNLDAKDGRPVPK